VKRWWLVLLLLLSVGVNLGLLAAFAVRRPGPASGPEPGNRTLPPLAGPGAGADPLARVVRLADFLGLEGEERRRFVNLQLSFFQETLKLRAEMGEVNRELRRELASPRPDRRRIDSLLERSSRTHLGLEQALARNVLASRELLDERQERRYLRLIGRLRPAGPLGLFSDRPPRREPGQRPGPWRRERFERRLPPPEEDGPEPPL
jgi:hypothetical protein